MVMNFIHGGMVEYQDHGAYEKAPFKECFERAKKKPIGCRWVIIDKGGKASPEYRARLVAKEIKKATRDDLFAAMPPLGAKKLLFFLSQSMPGNSRGACKLLFIGIKRAYFHAKAVRDVYVELPG